MPSSRPMAIRWWRFPLDVSDAESIQAAAKVAGDVQIVINNAGVF